MFNTRTIVLSLACTLGLVTACDAGLDEEFDVSAEGEFSFRSGGQGGPRFNTGTVNGTPVAAVDTKNQELDGVRLDAVYVRHGAQWLKIDEGGLEVDGGAVIGTHTQGAVTMTFIGEDFEESWWLFQVNGQPSWLRIAEISNGADTGLHDPLHTMLLRRLSPDRLTYRFVDHSSFSNPLEYCEADEFGMRWSLMFNDLYVDEDSGDFSLREDTIYFGCTRGAVAKTAIFGFEYDAPGGGGVSMQKAETGTRMTRADYCADGNSHTETGQEIGILDRDGITSHPENLDNEALWMLEGGAACVNLHREKNLLLNEPFVCDDLTEIPLCGTQQEMQQLWDDDLGYIWSQANGAV